MAPLQKECSTLWNADINPTELIRIAQYLNMPELVARAFPEMPVHMQADIMTGQTNIKLVNNVWSSVDGEVYVRDVFDDIHDADCRINANPELYINR